jgi:CAAX protease family protein
VLVPAMLVPFVGAMLYFVVLSGTAVGKVVYVATKLFTVGWPLFCVLVVFRTGFPRVDLRSAHHRRALPAGVGVGLLIVAAMGLILATPMREIVLANAEKITGKIDELGIAGYFIPFALFISVLHAFIEEYYWRWFVYGQLRRVVGMGPALALGGVSFALHRVVITSQILPIGWAILFAAMVGVGGVIWAWMYQRQRTLAGVWVSHMFADLGIMAVAYWLLTAR